MKETLILVADFSENLESLSEVLTDEGFTLVFASNHAQVVSMIRQGIPDLILISLLKSNSKGIEICNELKKNSKTNDVPVIFLCDSLNQETKILAYEVGADDFIERPFIAIEVLKKIGTQIYVRNSQEEIIQYLNKFQTAEKLLNMGNWEWDVAKNTVNWSNGLFNIYGENKQSYTPTFEGYIGKIVEEDAGRVQKTIMDAFQNKNNFQCEERIKKLDGEVRHLKTWGEVVLDKAGNVARMNGACLDITEAKNEEADIKSIADLTSTVGGINYFEAVTNYLTTKLDIRYAFIGEFFAETHSVRTIGVSDKGVAVENISYELKNTPSNNLLNKECQVYLDKCYEQFPLDEDLKRMNIEGYIGIPLFRDDEPIGIIVLMSEKPIKNANRIQRHLNALTVRTETEISRYQKERDLDEYKRYFSMSTDLLCVINKNDFYERVNPAFVNKLGYSEVELKSKPIIEFVHPEDVELTLKEMEHIKNKNSGSDEFVNRMRCKNGSYISLLWSSSTDLSSGKVFRAARDVTDIRKHEEALRVTQERLSVAISAGTIGVWDWNVVNNELTWDDSMYNLYKLKRSDYTSDYDAWKKSLHTDDFKIAQSALDKALTGEREFDLEYRVYDGDGLVKHVKAKAEVQFEDGVAVRMIGVCVDVTRLVMAEEKQLKLKDSLSKEMELSELKSRFVSTASHQFRTPLAVIQSNLGLLEMQIDQVSESFRPKIERVSERIKREVLRMTGLMDDVLIIGKINVGGVVPIFKEIDLVELFEEVLQNINPIQNDNRKAIIEVEGPRRLMDLDEKLISHALSNIISNAFKYSIGKDAPVVRIQFNEANVTVEVQDFGVGIPKGELQYLFDPFYRASNVLEIPGTGLGTSIIKEYVEVNKGTVKIESEQDQGCLVTLLF